MIWKLGKQYQVKVSSWLTILENLNERTDINKD